MSGCVSLMGEDDVVPESGKSIGGEAGGGLLSVVRERCFDHGIGVKPSGRSAVSVILGEDGIDVCANSSSVIHGGTNGMKPGGKSRSIVSLMPSVYWLVVGGRSRGVDPKGSSLDLSKIRKSEFLRIPWSNSMLSY